MNTLKQLAVIFSALIIGSFAYGDAGPSMLISVSICEEVKGDFSKMKAKELIVGEKLSSISKDGEVNSKTLEGRNGQFYIMVAGPTEDGRYTVKVDYTGNDGAKARLLVTGEEGSSASAQSGFCESPDEVGKHVTLLAIE